MKHNVLFLCSHNTCRSQMAEAFLRRDAGDRFEIYSAGLEPRGVHPLTVQVMDEIGIDITGQRSKAVRDVLGRIGFRHVIFVCHAAEQNCPTIFPFSTNRLSWPFDDPTAFEGPDDERLTRFRDVRDQIEARIQTWLQELDTVEAPSS